MSNSIKIITIYGASSSKINPLYLKMANQLGQLMALNGITCINGGGANGLMGAVTDGALLAGGEVIGVIPQFMIDEGWMHKSLTRVVPTKDMHTRKQFMASEADACIALPGGIGTLEELLEIMTWKQLGLYRKPLVILNTEGYYDGLLTMLEKAADENFIHQKHQTIWELADTPEKALSIVMERKEWHANPRLFAAL